MTTREQAIEHRLCMTPEECDECNLSYRKWQSYMVTDKVWNIEARLPTYGYLLCAPCLEKRLGRLLTVEDFTAYPINSSPFATAQQREIARLERELVEARALAKVES